jgi:uncharacterized membrane protein
MLVIRSSPKEPLGERVLSALGRHWLRAALIALGLFAGLPWIAPLSAALGLWGIADRIYTLYMFVCHQLPERAATLFGYQVAYCWRNTAIYTGLFLFGALYGLARDRHVSWLAWLPRSVPLWGFMLLLVPMALDGLSHMFGLRDSTLGEQSFGSLLTGSQVLSLNWFLRVFTGSLAALGAVWFAFPRINKAMQEAEALRLAYAEARTVRVVIQPGHPEELEAIGIIDRQGGRLQPGR